MYRLSRITTIAFVLFLAAGAMAEPANKGPNGSAQKPKGAQATALAPQELAVELIAYGRANKSAEALLAAAQILAANPGQATPREKTVEGTVPSAVEADKKPAILPSAEELLKEAAALAKGNKPLETAISSTKFGAARGAAGGRQVTRDRVYPGATDVYKIVFKGREQAQIGVIGDGDSDIDCFVYDENGGLIDSDTRTVPGCVLEFVPAWTGPFFVKITNVGSIASRYILVTN